MSREAPMSTSKPPKSGAWWIKIGVTSVVLLVLTAIAGLEVRREQLRGVVREATRLPEPSEEVAEPRPVFFVDATEGEWVECVGRLPTWWEGSDGAARWSDDIIDCASRREIGDTTRYIHFGWASMITDHAVTLEPRECMQLAFAVLRSSQDALHVERAYSYPIYGSRYTESIRSGVTTLAACGGDEDLREEARQGLQTLEDDVPSLRPVLDSLDEMQRQRAYRWLARTAWDYDDPFFYETSGVISRYRRQLTEYARWRRVSTIVGSATNLSDLAPHLAELREDPELELGGIEQNFEHTTLLRAGRMLLGGAPERDPETGRVMHFNGECVQPASSHPTLCRR